MLYSDPATKFPVRMQAPFVTTAEIDKIVEQIKLKYMK
jgi:DNA segregation ATPase FtsK/SpoIIIE-like protein